MNGRSTDRPSSFSNDLYGFDLRMLQFIYRTLYLMWFGISAISRWCEVQRSGDVERAEIPVMFLSTTPIIPRAISLIHDIYRECIIALPLRQT
ncbi:hypothetical protein E2C01_076217 [Portunus trituberculatus]|uniref:Uncharacterized protein n=1 Tax=Portunus trituberculatus TaxID=210409 RepID=A0A5B7ICM7_PORTR|nr:hypothetical protein [Portunus trituberculatus]